MLQENGKNRLAGVRFWAWWDFTKPPWYMLLEYHSKQDIYGVPVYNFTQYYHPNGEMISITEGGMIDGIIRPFCLGKDALDILEIIDGDPHAPV